MKNFERVDQRPAVWKGGEVRFMCQSGGYVMVRRPRCMPFVLQLKEWAKLPKLAAPAPSEAAKETTSARPSDGE